MRVVTVIFALAYVHAWGTHSSIDALFFLGSPSNSYILTYFYILTFALNFFLNFH